MWVFRAVSHPLHLYIISLIMYAKSMFGNKPHLKNGLEPFLTAYEPRNGGLTYSRFTEIMAMDKLADRTRISIISQEAGKLRNTVKLWVEQYRKEQNGR
jgi:hypothetical protein